MTESNSIACESRCLSRIIVSWVLIICIQSSNRKTLSDETFCFPEKRLLSILNFVLQVTFTSCWLATNQLSWNVLLFSCNPIGQLCLRGPSYSNRTVIKIWFQVYFTRQTCFDLFPLTFNCQKPCLYFSSATLHFSLKSSSTDSDFFFSHNSWISGSSLFARTISSISLWLKFLYLSSSSCLTSLHIVLAFSRSSFVRYTFPTPRVACSTE